jgi:acyl-CoA synthetase (AMP-forming)/AMP-acid ligase II/acyl carrier protein
MPLFHIHGLIGVLLSSLASGGTVICTPGFDSEKILYWLETLQPTWYSAVPTMHQAILGKLETKPNFQSSLRFMRSSSAALPSQVMIGLEQALKAPVIEAYGMTEASHQMTSNPLPPGKRKPGSVGLPAGPEIAIMDEEGNLLSQGNTGEVVIRGVNVTQGYENNPEANEKAFTKDWFRTGDQGYLDEDGYLFLKGRLKEIINRGGEKISPLEVDTVLMEIPGIAQAVTFAIPHPTLGEDVAAAVVLKNNVELSTIAIREFLLQNLANFKVPSQIAIVAEIPKGATGKIQRIGLAQKLETQLQQPVILPHNEIEQKIAAIFSEVLGKENISTLDNFFALGGDSLTGTRVIARLNELFELDLVNTLIFHKPTIAELAPTIQSLIEDSENNHIAELVATLENMSPEEIEQILQD